MKQYFNSLRKSAWVVSAVLVLASCNDWDDHYSYKPDTDVPVKSLAQTLEEMPEAADFIKVLQTTYMMNGDKVVKSLTYWDLMEDDQFFTVWLPTGTIAPENLASPAQKDHKKVAQQFVQNHIARFRHNVNLHSAGRIYMLNGKSYDSHSTDMGGIPYSSVQNIRCTNGIIHVLNGQLDYRPSIYDYITKVSANTASRTGQHYDYTDVLGKWFAKYTEEKLDEEKSVVSGYDPSIGKTVYADSVIIKKSILMNRYGQISSEDSNYVVVLPTPELWSTMYDSISQYYYYGSVVVDPDSLQQFYTNYSMLTDMFFNMNIQRSPADSVTSTLYNKNYNIKKKISYNVYNKPYAADGLFGKSVDSIFCSNGKIYIIDEWPFKEELIFRKPIKIEVEDYRFEGNDNKVNNNRRIAMFKDKEVDNVFIGELRHQSNSPSWTASFKIRNNLSGKYALKMVIYPCATQSNRPNSFHPVLSYAAEKDYVTLLDSIERIKTPPFRRAYSYVNDTSKIDTINLGIVDFPTCNYDKDEKNATRIQLDLSSTVNSNNAKNFSSVIWLDCIILDPVIE